MYSSKLSLIETEIAIKKIKDFFESTLAEKLNLTRVSAPLFLDKNSGLNDNLNGVEIPVSFEVDGKKLEIVHSLAKWKRNALKEYHFEVGQGLYTDMNAVRKDEVMDRIHSIYVDQWDWEKIITKEERNVEKLKETVNLIYSALKETDNLVRKLYPQLTNTIPDNIHFITSEELLKAYPDLSAKQREREMTKKYGAVFIMQIGDKLSNGESHDGRSPDYDDWSLNGDILVYDHVNDDSLELSSMGIRVDETSLLEQLKKANCLDRIDYPYHQHILRKELPYTIGGGIGQSRMCMFFLDKKHIGEVQASYWSEEEIKKCEEDGIHLL